MNCNLSEIFYVNVTTDRINAIALWQLILGKAAIVHQLQPQLAFSNQHYMAMTIQELVSRMFWRINLLY